MLPNPQEIKDLVTFTEEIVHGKLHFLRRASVSASKMDRVFLKPLKKKKSKSNLQELLQEIFLENLWEDSLALTLYTISPGWKLSKKYLKNRSESYLRITSI